jgi:hypothetical protein
MPQETWTLVDDKPKGETWTLVDTPLPPKKTPPMIMPGGAAPEKKSFLESLKDVNWSRGGKVQGPRNPDLEMKSFKDIAQAAGSSVTGMAAFPLSLAVQGAMRSRGIDKQTAQDVGQYGAGKIMVKTTTPGARAGAEALATPFAPFSMALDAIKDPDLKLLAGVAMLAYPYAKAGIKGFIKGRIASGRGITPKELDVIIKTTDLPPDVAAKVESTRLQSPPEPTGNPVADAKAQADFLAAQGAKAQAAPANSPGISVTPPAGPTTGVKVGEIPGVKPANIQPINISPAKALADALKQAPRLLPQQKSMYAKEAGERLRKAEEAGGPIGGEKGFEAAYAQMKGKMKKVDFELPDIGAGNRESLFQMIWDDPYLTQGERFSVAGRPETAGHSSSGLVGMLDFGKFPAKREIELMNRVFGNEVGDALIGKMSKREQAMFWATNIANIPRTMMASFDLSAPLRQGIWFVGRPRQFARSMKAMFQALKSEDGYNAVVQNMAKKPTFKLGRERGLALAEIGSALNKTEEQFIGSGILERAGKAALKKWPDIRGKALNIIPEGVKASQRAYTGFLNKMRADVFDSMVNDATKLGLFTDKKSGVTDIFGINEKLSTDIARYVNIGSGRGNISGLAKDHAALTNALLFSPRLMSARLALFDPRTYFTVPKFARGALEKKGLFYDVGSQPKVSSFVRQEARRDAAAFASFYVVSIILAKAVLGQEIGADPRSSDFTKIISGNTSVDLSGGIGSYARTAAQLSQQLFEKLGIIDESFIVSSTSGKKTKMGGGFNEVSFGDVLVKFFSQKENPVVSFFSNLAFQRDETGKPMNMAKEVKERIIPIVAQDLVELYKDDPDLFKMSVMGLLTLFGAGVQTYPAKKEGSFVDQGTKTRQEMFSKEPSGDRVIEELNKSGVKAVLGAKKVNGQPVPEEDIPTVLKEAGPEIRLRVNLYLNNPAFAKATPEQKKKWLQGAVNSGWNAYKNKKKLGVK